MGRHDDSPKILSPDELPPAMKTAFGKIFAYKRRVEALKAEHIAPIADEITALWRDLKAGSGMTRKDLELVFKICERLWLAEQMNDEAEGRRIQDNIRRAFAAAKRGEIINFLDVLAGNAETPTDEDQGGDSELEDEGTAVEEPIGGEPAPLNLDQSQPRVDAEQGNAGPDADWGDDQAPVPAEQDSGNDAGYAFQWGEQAGLEGKLDVKALIKQHGKNGRSAWAKSFAAGHAQGVKKRQQQAEQPMTDDEAFEITNAGNKAGYEGEPLSTNPHDPGTDRAERWAAGHEGGVIRRRNEEANGDETPGLNVLPMNKVVNLGDHRPAFPN